MSEIERERMEYDVVIVGAGPARPCRGDPAEAVDPAIFPFSCWKKAPKSAPIFCRALWSIRSPSTS